MKAAIQEYFHSLACSEDFVRSSTCNLLGLRANDPCFLFDLHSGRIQYICNSISSLLGYREDEFMNKGLAYLKQIIHPEDFPAFISEMTFYSNSTVISNYKHNGVKHTAIRIKHKEGYWVHVCIVFSYLSKFNFRLQEYIIGKICKSCFEDDVIYCVYGTRVSKREQEVLQLLGTGDSSKIIADKLHIGETTVITHRKNLIQKFRVRNTAELIKKAAKSGMIE